MPPIRPITACWCILSPRTTLQPLSTDFDLSINVLRRLVLLAKAAQHVAHQIAHRRTRQGSERQRPDDVYCREAQACGEEAVEQALAEPRRQFTSDAVAEHLLDQAVGGRHAA